MFSYLSDPDAVHLGLAAWYAIALLFWIGPVSAWRSHRRLAQGGALPSRMRLYAMNIFVQAALATLALLVARQSNIDLFPHTTIGWREIGLGAAALALGFSTLHPAIRSRNPVGRQRVLLLAPRTPAERLLFLGLCASAAVSEELIYRGVAFTIFAVLTGSFWLATFITAAFFGAAHMAQGPRTAMIVFLLGVRDHLLVGLTGTLYVMMVLHFVHDVVMGTIASVRAGREPVPVTELAA